jgi:hypothetical protein
MAVAGRPDVKKSVEYSIETGGEGSFAEKRAKERAWERELIRRPQKVMRRFGG